MEEKSGKVSNRKLIILIVSIAVLVVSILLYFFLSNRQEYKAVVEEMTEEKLILTEEFQNLALDYDSLYSSNDTLNLLLEQEREKITQLIEEIKTIKATNAKKIREYKKELTSLRGVMRNFVVQIDSLNRRNEELTLENIQYRKKHDEIEHSYKVLEEEKKTLDKKVEIASQLEGRDIEVIGLNSKGKITKKTRSVSKIRTCCTVLKNITAPVGIKKAYVRIMRPDEVLLVSSIDDLFTYEGQEINFTACREFEYGGEDVDVCIFYNAEEGELLSGVYTIDIFIDGFNIGTSIFELK